MLSALDVLSTNVTSSTELLIATALLENLTIDAIQDLNVSFSIIHVYLLKISLLENNIFNQTYTLNACCSAILYRKQTVLDTCTCSWSNSSSSKIRNLVRTYFLIQSHVHVFVHDVTCPLMRRKQFLIPVCMICQVFNC